MKPCVSQGQDERARILQGREHQEAGKPATYIPNYNWDANRKEDAPPQRIEQPVEPVKPVEKTASKTTAWAAKQKKIEEERLAKQAEARRQREADEQARKEAAHQHQKRLAEEAGVNLEGKTVRRITASTSKPVKRIIPAWDGTKAKAKVDGNDL